MMKTMMMNTQTEEEAIRNEPAPAATMTLTVEEFAREFNISLPTAYKLARKRSFPSFRLGRRILVNRSKLQEWLDQQCIAG